jgi:hypothetical protein
MNLVVFLVVLVILVIVFGLIMWLISALPIDDRFKRVAQILMILVAIIFLLSMLFGWLPLPRSFNLR